VLAEGWTPLGESPTVINRSILGGREERFTTNDRSQAQLVGMNKPAVEEEGL